MSTSDSPKHAATIRSMEDMAVAWMAHATAALKLQKERAETGDTEPLKEIGSLRLSELDIGVKVDLSKLPNRGEGIEPRDAVWKQPTPYDYQAYLTGGTALLNPKESVDAARAEREWASSAVRYEWSDEFGEIGPPDPVVEKELFDDDFLLRVGMNFDKYSYECEIKGPFNPGHISKWEDSGLHPQVLENIAKCRYARPSPVQSFVIPAALSGLDIVAISQTGTGKTGAYLIPIISRLMGKAKRLCAPKPSGYGSTVLDVEPLVLVICPTRELAIQVFKDACRLSYRSMLRPCVAYGGERNRRGQIEQLRRGCDILIGTPGRLWDFCSQANIVSLRRVKYTVIDEADELLEDDWAECVDQLLRGGDVNGDGDHAYMMFSATFPRRIRQLAGKHMSKEFVRVKCGRIGSATNNVCQRILFVVRELKNKCILDLLNTLPPTRTLIFVRTKRAADMLDDFLYSHGMPVTCIHGDKTQAEREDAMENFKKADCPILIATGISSRGIDIVNVMHVINFDLPLADQGGIKEYVHRIGRTARMGNIGMATSFYNEDDEGIASDLVKVLLENDQEIPPFLEEFKPEGELNFESDDEGSVDSYADFHAHQDDDPSSSDEEGEDGSKESGSDAGSAMSPVVASAWD